MVVGGKRPGCKPPAGGLNTQNMMVYVDDADAHCERARACGATITSEPTTTDYGGDYWTDRGYECKDIGGHTWCVLPKTQCREQTSLTTTATARLDRTLSALADPTPRSVSELLCWSPDPNTYAAIRSRRRNSKWPRAPHSTARAPRKTHTRRSGHRNPGIPRMAPD